jgi:hypothetical protein
MGISAVAIDLVKVKKAYCPVGPNFWSYCPYEDKL